MGHPSPNAQDVLDDLGNFVPEQNAERDLYQSSSVLGPYQYGNGTFRGQFKNGKRHGFGTFVRFITELENKFSFEV